MRARTASALGAVGTIGAGGLAALVAHLWGRHWTAGYRAGLRHTLPPYQPAPGDPRWGPPQGPQDATKARCGLSTPRAVPAPPRWQSDPEGLPDRWAGR